MYRTAQILIFLIALLHLYIGWFEVFAWQEKGPAIFSSFPPEIFPLTTQMAANQGLYNVFLAAGLLWSLTIKDRDWARKVATCFLMFVAVAGVFGAMTVAVKVMGFQTVPSVLALILLHLGARKPA